MLESKSRSLMRRGKFCQKLTHFVENHFYKVNASAGIKRLDENYINVIVSCRNSAKKVVSILRENFIFISLYYDFLFLNYCRLFDSQDIELNVDTQNVTDMTGLLI